jgi:hypothetical protein
MTALGIPWANDEEAFAWLRRLAPSAKTIEAYVDPTDIDRRRVIVLYGATEEEQRRVETRLGLWLLGDHFRVERR